RHGLDDARLAGAALHLFELVLDLPMAAGLREAVTEFADRYVRRGRCPADEAIEGHRLRRPPAPYPSAGRQEGAS
ncbi:MAG TPA: hypothetical protein VFJ97_03375, partial [Dermatophilaceae bacterium]|nr:hypothetical protein [Dermatophilaceae bacterium]